MVIELDTQRPRREPMMKACSPAHYLGALSENGERLTLVSIAPDDPWQAFRAMRRRLRRKHETVALSLYDAPRPIEHSAEIVVLRPSRVG